MECSNLKVLICQIESADFKQAKISQLELANKISLIDDYSTIETIAGLDVGYEQNNTVARGGIVILKFSGFQGH